MSIYERERDEDGCPILDITFASYDAEAKRMTVCEPHHYYEFEVFTQDELDSYLTIDNCLEFLKEHSGLPKCYKTYEEWAKHIFDEENPFEIMLDTSHKAQWPEICKKADVDFDTLRYSDFIYEDDYIMIPNEGHFYGYVTYNND